MPDWKRSSNRHKAAAFEFYGLPHNFKTRAAPKPSGKPLEASVIAAVTDLLAAHPRIALAVRQNSGAASYEAASGKYAPVWFYKIIRGREHLKQLTTITDFWGLLIDGRPFAIEAKRPGWKYHFSDDRAVRQNAFIGLIKKHGGIGGFVTSVEEAQALLA